MRGFSFSLKRPHQLYGADVWGISPLTKISCLTRLLAICFITLNLSKMGIADQSLHNPNQFHNSSCFHLTFRYAENVKSYHFSDSLAEMIMILSSNKHSRTPQVVHSVLKIFYIK